MIEQIKNEQEAFKEIQLLVFNIMGVRLGIDIDQIYEIYEILEQDPMKRERYGASWFHEKIPFRINPIIYKSPKLLLVRDEETTSGIIIDQPEDILSVTIDAIQPLPPLLEALNRSSAIWGVTLKDEEIILLVDLYKLNIQKTDTD